MFTRRDPSEPEQVTTQSRNAPGRPEWLNWASSRAITVQTSCDKSSTSAGGISWRSSQRRMKSV